MLAALAFASGASCARDVTLPDAAYSTVAFSDSGGVYVTTASADGAVFELFSFDFKQRGVQWRQKLAGLGVVEYDGDDRLLVAEQPGRDAAVSIVDAKTGTSSFRTVLPGIEMIPVSRPSGATRHMATSGRGRWLAVAARYGPMQIYDTRSSQTAGAPSPIWERPWQVVVRSVVGNPHADVFALYEVQNDARHRVIVVALDGDRWLHADTLEDAAWPTWTRHGLIVISPDGLTLSNGQVRSSIADKDQIDTGPSLDSAPYQLSSDGTRGIAATQRTLTVFDVVGVKTVRTIPVDTDPRPPPVITAAFSADAIWALLNTGELLRIGPDDKPTVYKRLGPPSKIKDNFVLEGSHEQVNYQAELAPDGTFLSVYRPARSRKIYRLP